MTNKKLLDEADAEKNPKGYTNNTQIDEKPNKVCEECLHLFPGGNAWVDGTERFCYPEKSADYKVKKRWDVITGEEELDHKDFKRGRKIYCAVLNKDGNCPYFKEK